MKGYKCLTTQLPVQPVTEKYVDNRLITKIPVEPISDDESSSSSSGWTTDDDSSLASEEFDDWFSAAFKNYENTGNKEPFERIYKKRKLN